MTGARRSAATGRLVRADLTRVRAYARLLGSIGVNRVAVMRMQHTYDTHFAGREQVAAMREAWAAVAGRVPAATFDRVQELLDEQLRSATEWREGHDLLPAQVRRAGRAGQADPPLAPIRVQNP